MRRISIALAALATVAITAHADVYKSVDAQGQVRYSDTWSPGATLIKTDRSRGTPSPAETPSPPAASDGEESGKSDAAKKVQSDMSAIRAEQCKQLKEQYAKVIRARRITQAGDSSAPKQYMSDAEADAERVRTRQAMDEACAGGASS
jgi:hypothetical protein